MNILSRAPYCQSVVVLNSPGLAKHGQESIQYATVALADSRPPLMIAHESIHGLVIQIRKFDAIPMKPSI